MKALAVLLAVGTFQPQIPKTWKTSDVEALGMNAQDRTLRNVTSSRFRLTYNFCGGQHGIANC